jgi:hypothetical protein
MEKTFSLDSKEQQMLGGLEQDNLRLNARYGQICREREDLERRIAASEEQQRSFLRNSLANRGVEQFEAAQILNGQLVCRLADQPMLIDGEPIKSDKPNGLPALEN